MNKLASYESINSAIEGCFGTGVHVIDRSYVGGGDINNAACLKLSSGKKVFVKSNSLSNRGFFDAEEKGINAIAVTNTIGTPKLLCKGTDKNTSFLMMEMIEEGPRAKDSWEVFGRELAAMHLAETSDFVDGGNYGFLDNNYIGASKQINTPKDTWIDFFRECRLEPQVNMASHCFDKGLLKDILRLLDRLDDLLTEPEQPSLLHGDLWSGNIITGRDGRIMLIDPAVYVGHAEADIAMTELFGRLPEAFYREYASDMRTQPGYKDRRELYNLYHMLNHLNLFGGSYLYSVASIIKRYV